MCICVYKFVFAFVFGELHFDDSHYVRQRDFVICDFVNVLRDMHW